MNKAKASKSDGRSVFGKTFAPLTAHCSCILYTFYSFGNDWSSLVNLQSRGAGPIKQNAFLVFISKVKADLIHIPRLSASSFTVNLAYLLD